MTGRAAVAAVLARPWRQWRRLRGRAGSVEAVLFVASVAIACTIAVAVGQVALEKLGVDARERYWAGEWWRIGVQPVGALAILFFALSLVAGITLGVRRLHDIGLSGWWFWLLPVAMFVEQLHWAQGVLLVLLIIVPGRRGDNRYGPDPRARLAPDEARKLREVFR